MKIYLKKINFLSITTVFVFCSIFNSCQSTSNKNNIERIQSLNSYQTNLTERDIASFFRHSANKYLSQANYYLCDYEVYYSKDEQNYAWKCDIDKFIFNWGIAYMITLSTNNGSFHLMTSNSPFSFGGNSAKEIITFLYNTVGWGNVCKDIMHSIFAFANEMGIAAKQNNLYLSDSVFEGLNETNMFQ